MSEPGSVAAPATEPRRPRPGAPGRDVVLTVAVFVVFVGAWEGFIAWRDLSPLVLPSPGRVAGSLLEMITSGLVLPHTAITLTEIVLGFAVGSVVGIGLGTLLVQSPLALRVASPYVIASQAVPKLALAPIFALWFGFGLAPKIVIAALIAFFPLLENTIRGLTEVDPDQVDLFRTLRADRRQVFLKLHLPNAMPYVFTGLRVAMILAVVGAVVGEYVGANQGLGALIIASQGAFKTSQMFAVIVLLTVIGLLLYKAVEVAEALYLRAAFGESRRGEEGHA